MKIGVVSDTHKNVELLDKVVSWLVAHERIATLYHLGDDYDDVKGVRDAGFEILQVPGIYDHQFLDRSAPEKLTDSVLGLQLLLVHSREKSVLPEDVMVHDIVLFGHTHKPELALIDGHLFFNPGHLKGGKDKTIEPSFGLLDIHEQNVTAAIYDLDFRVHQSMKMVRSESGLYKT
jgi:putative phosphoesterase